MPWFNEKSGKWENYDTEPVENAYFKLMTQEEGEEFKRICHQMSYGDDSKKTWKRYCELAGITGSEEELELKRQETFE